VGQVDNLEYTSSLDVLRKGGKEGGGEGYLDKHKRGAWSCCKKQLEKPSREPEPRKGKKRGKEGKDEEEKIRGQHARKTLQRERQVKFT